MHRGDDIGPARTHTTQRSGAIRAVPAVRAVLAVSAATAVFALLSTVLAVGLVAVDARPAAAQDDDGLRMVVDAVYRVLPDEGVVEVELDYVVTNQIPDRTRGFEIIQTFFRSILSVIPDDAVDLRAVRDNGDTLAVSPAELSGEDAATFEDSPFGLWEVDLGPNLFYQQTRRFTVSFRLPDGAPRSPDAWARVNPAYASFPATARGDRGLSSVRIEFPPGYVVESFGSEMERSDPFGSTVLTATEIAEPFEFFVVVVGSSELGLSSRTVDVDGLDDVDADLVISSWPGDVEWDAFVEDGLVRGIPLLEDEIGVDWPVEGELEVIQTVAPALAGYGGWYYEPLGSDGSDAAIDVGEELVLDLLGHEIAHAWFNDDFSRMRWLNEGLAEYFGNRVAAELDEGSVDIFDSVTRASDGAVDLIDWRDPFFFAEEEDPTEAFGYSASYQVIAELVDEIGPDGLEATLVSLFAVENPYRPELTDPGQASVDWRDLLDALELVGGSEIAEELLVEWVLNEREEEKLEGRREAQEAVAAIGERDPGWEVPDALPTLLARWDFDDAQDLVVEMEAILDRAVALLDDAATRGIALPTDPQEAYEAAGEAEGQSASGGFESVGIMQDEQRAALDRVLGAYVRAEEPTSFFENIGLYGTDVDAIVADAHAAFEAGDYDAAAGFADDVDELLDGAESDGQTRVAIVVGAAVLLLLLVLVAVLVLRRRRRRRRRGEPDEVVAAAPAETDAAVPAGATGDGYSGEDSGHADAGAGGDAEQAAGQYADAGGDAGAGEEAGQDEAGAGGDAEQDADAGEDGEQAVVPPLFSSFGGPPAGPDQPGEPDQPCEPDQPDQPDEPDDRTPGSGGGAGE